MKTLTLRRLRINTRALALPSNPVLEKRLILGLLGAILILSITYGYFVKQTIVNVVERKEIGTEMADLGSKVSTMEVEYIELKNKISLDFAYSLGYSEADDIKFVSRTEPAKNVTLND